MGPDPARAMVLLVDDDRRNRTLLRDYLESGYEIREAENGRQALELIASEHIDLVLLDVMMPELSGFDTCRKIRERRVEGFLPVILLTALSEQEDRNAGLSAGADDFLTKPVDRRELLLRVRAFLKMREQDAQIRRQLDDLHRLQRLKDDLVSLIVHDVRNPLMGVQGFLELLQRRFHKSSQPDVRVFIDRACESSARLKEILEDMLSVRVLEQGELALDRRRVRLGELAAQSLATVEGTARISGVSVELSVEKDPVILADEKLLRRSIENLIANAVKYSPGGSTVDVTVRSARGRAEIDISDRGPGIPDDMKSEIFERFGSVEARRETVRRGFGLGLYLVRLVTLAHQGTACVRDREGGGSVFTLSLPKPPRH